MLNYQLLKYSGVHLAFLGFVVAISNKGFTFDVAFRMLNNAATRFGGCYYRGAVNGPVNIVAFVVDLITGS